LTPYSALPNQASPKRRDNRSVHLDRRPTDVDRKRLRNHGADRITLRVGRARRAERIEVLDGVAQVRCDRASRRASSRRAAFVTELVLRRVLGVLVRIAVEPDAVLVGRQIGQRNVYRSASSGGEPGPTANRNVPFAPSSTEMPIRPSVLAAKVDHFDSTMRRRASRAARRRCSAQPCDVGVLAQRLVELIR